MVKALVTAMTESTEDRNNGTVAGVTATAAAEAAAPSKWYRWRRDGMALIRYLLDSEVHTFAFSVAANAIISFIPFVVLLYTLALSVFHSRSHEGRCRRRW